LRRWKSLKAANENLAESSLGMELSHFHGVKTLPLLSSGRSLACFSLREKPSDWWPEVELNHRHEDFQSTALPTELSGHLGKAGIKPAATNRVKIG
jgi:hypothetical protein